MTDEKISVMNDDDSHSILERQTTPATESVISLKAMRCHGLNSRSLNPSPYCHSKCTCVCSMKKTLHRVAMQCDCEAAVEIPNKDLKQR